MKLARVLIHLQVDSEEDADQFIQAVNEICLALQARGKTIALTADFIDGSPMDVYNETQLGTVPAKTTLKGN